MAPPAAGEQGGVLPVQRPVSMIGVGLRSPGVVPAGLFLQRLPVGMISLP